MSPQLSCVDICQIITWHFLGNQYFDNSKKNGKALERKIVTSLLFIHIHIFIEIWLKY